MQTKLKLFASLFLLVGMGFYARAQSTAFTYQGRLNNGTNLAIGSFDLRFALFDSLTSGTQQGTTLTNVATAISNGLFTVTLNFGSQFPGPGPNRWLEIAVRTNGSGTFTLLAPRQPITPTPYAILQTIYSQWPVS